MNSDLAYGAVKRILFYVLYIHCFEGTDNNKCHSYDVQNIYILWITISGSTSMIAHVNNSSHNKTFGISSNNIHEMLFAILILKRFCNIWKGMKCSNLELRATQAYFCFLLHNFD